MPLTSRITLAGHETNDPEDYFASSLGIVFPDDITSQHGDSQNSLVYTTPVLSKPLHLKLCDPVEDSDRKLFSHHLWNSCLLLAEIMERGKSPAGGLGGDLSFDVTAQSCIELGAGAGLPSMMAALLGASSVTVTDYPSEVVLPVLRDNIRNNVTTANAPKPNLSTITTTPPDKILVQGHEWGFVDDQFSQAHKHAYTRVVTCDTLWMPWVHANLHASIAHFLSATDPGARAWVVAAFHTGREKMREFFAEKKLAAAGLQIDRIWERDCDGNERPWSWDRDEDVTARKRWLVVSVLKRLAVITT